MLRGIRKASGSWIGKSVMALVVGFLILAFGFWGIGDIFRGFGRGSVATIGSTEISVEQFRQEYNDRLQRLGRQFGRAFTPAQGRELRLPEQLLAELIGKAAMDEEVRKLGLRVSDAEVARQITSDPVFQGPSGQFDRERFEQAVRNEGFTEARYAGERRRTMLRLQLQGTIEGDVGRAQTAVQLYDRFDNEQRAIEYVMLDPAQAGDIPAPAPEALAAYFDERKERFRAPEYRNVVLLTLAPADVAATIAVSDAEARKFYDERAARAGGPRRRIEQIIFPNLEEARAAADRLANGLSFQALAAERGQKQQDIDLGLLSKSDVIDPAVAEAAFSLPEGGVSAPIVGRFGVTLARVAKIESFEDSVQQIKRDLALDRARSELQKLHDKIEDERGSGSGLEEIGKKVELKVRTVEAIDRSGRDPQGAPVADLPADADLVASIFASDLSADNEPLQTRSGSYVWYEVIKIVPSHLRSLDEVKDQVETSWRNDQIAERLAAKAAQIVEKLKAGAPFAEVAASFELKVETLTGLKRGSGAAPLSPDAVAAAFRLDKGAAGLAPGKDATERLVLRVTDITVPAFDPASPQGQRYNDTVRRGVSEALRQQYLGRLANDVGTKINQEALNSVLGGESN